MIPGAELPQPESGVARPVPDGGGGGGDGNSSQDGGEAADPDGQREAQQKHHAARQRGQDLGRGPVAALSGRLLALFSRSSRRAGNPGPLLPGRESSSRRGVAVQSPVGLKAAQPPREAPSRSASLCFGDLPPSLPGLVIPGRVCGGEGFCPRRLRGFGP